jgi:hypothetical protein
MSQDRRKRPIFSYEEALATFPHVRDTTREAIRRLEALINTVQSRDELAARQEEIEEACQLILEDWERRVTAFGCAVEGRWQVEWDCGDGFYCWQFPEPNLAFFHAYDESFAERLPIQ